MRLVFGLVLVAGVGLAGTAAYLAKDRIGQYQATLEAQRKALESTVPLKEVFVTKSKIEYGQEITKEDVRLVAWPENAIPEGAFLDPENLFHPNGELRTAIRIMEKDEAIMAVKVTEPGQDAGVSSRLEKGMRAFALRVDVSSGVSGFLRPGNKVDVYWTGAINGEETTRLIQRSVRLLAVDQISDSNRAAPTIARTVTVAASSDQVAALATAQASGRISLALVGENDDTQVPTTVVSIGEVLDIPEIVAAPVIVKEECFQTVRKGTEIQRVPVECPE